MKEKNYTLIVTVENQQNEIECRILKIRFSTNPDDYGSGTYMQVDRFGNYDIRYDSNYHPGREVAYIAAWAGEQWTGLNGSWTLIGLQITGALQED